MFKVSALQVAICVVAATCICSCSNPDGACVQGGGQTAICKDGVKEGSCTQWQGAVWLEGKTCKELGFARASVSTLVLADLFCTETDSGIAVQWIKILNASAMPIDLANYALVHFDDGDSAVCFGLEGEVDAQSIKTIEWCTVADPNRVLELAELGFPGRLAPGQGGVGQLVLALYDARVGSDDGHALSVAVVGAPPLEVLASLGCSDDSYLGTVVPGLGLERGPQATEACPITLMPDPDVVWQGLDCDWGCQ